MSHFADSQALYDAALRAHSEVMDRIIDQMELGYIPSSAEMQLEMQLREQLQKIVEDWAGPGQWPTTPLVAVVEPGETLDAHAPPGPGPTPSAEAARRRGSVRRRSRRRQASPVGTGVGP